MGLGTVAVGAWEIVAGLAASLVEEACELDIEGGGLAVGLAVFWWWRFGRGR